MKAATKRILCYILLCLFVLTTITASLTFGRYTSEKASDNDYKGDIEYILGDAIIINTIDDFFQAIENGYSNIQLGDELDNPLIISGGMSGVVSDLTIDLNGHEIQRNNREPILDVKEGINLTIIDTSAKKTGSLYNPVGSVLKVSGGTLTAAAGIFESGPRSGKRDNKGGRVETGSNYNEYAVAKGDTWSAHSGGEFNSQADIKDVQLFKNPLSDSEESGSVKYDEEGTVSLPIITPKMNTGTNLAVNGNMYFDSGVGVNIGNGIITDDTYLYYTFESENMEFSTVANNGSADYYYEYYVKGEQADGTVDFGYAENQNKKTEGDTRVLVTVYVYNSVKGSADAEGSAPPKYAAINMESGNLYARAGYYYSYFGEEDTYCVDATGGYMAVTLGQFNAFGKGVGIQCDYGESAEANEYLNITKGTFYSQDGDTIHVSGGKLEIGTADITKDATDSADDWFANGSAINVSGGDVTVNNSLEISVEGSGCAGIRSDGAGAVTANSECTITLTGDQNVGIYSGKPSDGISQPVIIGSQSSGAVTANITLNGEHSYGIQSEGGDVNIANGTAGGEVTFTIDSDNVYSGSDPTASDAPYSRAIYSNGGNINIGTMGKTKATFSLDGNYLQGIHANGGKVNICTADVADTSATFTLGDQAEKGATNITGIATGTAATVNIGSNSSTFTLNAYGETMSGIFAQGGAVNILGKATFELDGSGMGGIYSAGGSVVLNGKTTVNMADGIESSYGIAASQGTLTFNNSVEITAQGESTAAYGIHATGAGSVVDIGGTTTITYSGSATNSNGIHNVGGTVAISATTTITFPGGATNSNGIYNGADAEQGIDGGTIGLGYRLNEGSVEAVESSTAEFKVDLTAATGSTGIYSAGGTINISGSKYTSTIKESVGTDLNNAPILDNASIYATAGEVNFAASGTAPGDGVTLTSDCLGIVIRGKLNFNSGKVKIETPNGTAIYVYQGSLTADEDVTVDITSGINGNGWGVEGAESQTNIYNGVFVNGGSLTANGTLNVTHHGVENDQSVSGNDAFLKQTVKSFAVRVENSTGVNIAGGEISNAIGGGIYVGGGNVYLGATYSGGKYAQSANADDIKVSTTGAIAGNKIYFNGAATWSYDLLRTGGHAVEVSGGSLTVYGGTYSAAQGNGILVRNTSDSVANVTIEDGTFIGRNGGCGKYGANNKNVGPGVFYGLYVVGGNLNVVINNGTFGELNGESNSGASFYGTYGMSQRATVDIYKGKFYGHSADAISVFRFININIGNYIDINGNAVESDGSEIIIQTDNNDAAPLSAQDNLVEQYYGRGSNIKIYYGTFIGGRYDSGGYYNPYLKNNNYDNINEYGRRNTTGNNPDNVKTVFSYPKY